ncbi:MAG: DUF350 domain-containing protein [Spongiibacteraceae bacterium]
MDSDFAFATLFNFSVNIAYTVTALLVAVLSLKIVDKLLLKKLDIEDELKKNNIAVAIFSSSILVFVAILVAQGLRG